MSENNALDTLQDESLDDEALDGQFRAKLSAHSCITAYTGGCKAQ
ncbi:MAG: hypothetical protein O3A96_09970 [Proteobacteria bacterium]|nr:hypothetical protein [Pseudomonadota bacterium]